MDPIDVTDAPPAELRAHPLERADAPAALRVRADGVVVWRNAAAAALGAETRLDSASARAVAAVRGEGLLRLRIGGGGRFAPLAFRARRENDETVRLEALEAPPLRDRGGRPRARPELRDLAETEPWPGSEPGEENGAATVDAPPAPTPAEAEGAAASSSGADHADLRFVFEIDAEGRLTFLSPDLEGAVGPSAPAARGRLWSDLAEELALDPAGAVTAALARRGGWTGLRIDWPTAAGDRLALALSALPVFDRGRTFVGFRGLGVAAARPSPAAAGGRDAPEAVRDEGPLVLPADGEPAASPGDERASSGEAAAPAMLSSDEADAFDEIARRLEAGEIEPAPAAAREIWADIAADAEMTLGADAPPAPETASVGASDQIRPVAEAADLVRLLDRLPSGAIVLAGGVPVYANRAALEMSGHHDLADLASRDPASLFTSPLSLDDAAPVPLRLIAADGVEVDVEARLHVLDWDGAEARAIVVKRAEGVLVTAALAASQLRETELAAILDTATDGVLTLDAAGRVLSINRSAEALLGYEAHEIVGSLFSLALAPESRRTAFEYLDGLRSNPVASLLNDGREVLGLVRQGGAIPLYLTIGRIGQAEEGRYCAVLRDVTHWKRVEEELVAAKRQAERASAQKSDFLAKVSHEIRTPLNAIIGFAEVMMQERFGAIGNERYKDYLKDIHLSGQHLISLVNDLLDLSKIEAGRLELEFADVDLNDLVAQATALLQPQANRAHIIIRTSLARALPRVRADERSVRQIVLNLASNAVKFTQGGGQVIVATALNDLGEPVIRVRDTGVGMSRKEIALALEPFRQLPTGGGENAGLGLPLTKALAEANQATFSIQSAVGQGTLVEVAFPAARAAAG